MVYEGVYSGKGKRFALVCARFNEFIVTKLLGGAKDALLRHETAESDIDVIWVPGAFEIPLAALKAAESGRSNCKGIAVVRDMETGAVMIRAKITDNLGVGNLTSA